ncbi:ribosome maturation factor RimP [Thiohalobacter thiocyanaticus]|uniref:Ribosome maturation factor RimP n=1 Tax=Thiohalobacter thiocyanaticus TaxID=585455 RepID=A0A426QFZ8_9GAMM|nr:ribosome maturation factor RimP [Thiohalobacter thiocyanaticus]RRQ20675.1 ribosome maturation factor RimP [Thiohalobacter thiocyanaticus]
MRKDPFKLRELLEPAVRALGYELVGIEYHPSGKHSVLRIYIDQEEGITLDDCTAVSHQVSGILDVEDPVPGQYTLEISSPGLDRPLFQAADYERFRGQQVKLRLRLPVNGRRKFKGLLQGLRQDEVVIVDDEGNEVCLPLEQIEQARLVPEFQG